MPFPEARVEHGGNDDFGTAPEWIGDRRATTCSLPGRCGRLVVTELRMLSTVAHTDFRADVETDLHPDPPRARTMTRILPFANTAARSSAEHPHPGRAGQTGPHNIGWIFPERRLTEPCWAPRRLKCRGPAIHNPFFSLGFTVLP